MTALGNITPRNGGFDPVPSGPYTAAITDHTESIPAKSGQGEHVTVTYTILEGECAGRKLFQLINHRNNSQKAEEIGLKQLEQIAFACGHSGKDFDLGECHNIPCLVIVGIKTDPTGMYEPQNVVLRVKKLPKPSENSPAGSQGPKSPGPASGGSAPWRQ